MGRIGCALVLLGAAPPPAERVVTPGDTVAVTVNGVPARLSIDPDASGMPMVAQSFATRARLSCAPPCLGRFCEPPCWVLGLQLGRERIFGRAAVARFGWNGAASMPRRVSWYGRDWGDGLDGAIGPTGFPERIVRFSIGPSRPGERTATLPVFERTNLPWWSLIVHGTLKVGGKDVQVRFDLRNRRSLATAGAAVLIARAHGGTMTGERARQVVLLGVERPIAMMRLARPLAVGPLALTNLGVRVTDGSGANTIPQADADPSEVVVTARGKQTQRFLSIGRDDLARCSSLVFDKGARQIRLTCA